MLAGQIDVLVPRVVIGELDVVHAVAGVVPGGSGDRQGSAAAGAGPGEVFGRERGDGERGRDKEEV